MHYFAPGMQWPLGPALGAVVHAWPLLVPGALVAPGAGVVERELPETFMPSDAIQCKPLEVVVSDRGIERAIKMLKRKLASEGVLVSSRCAATT